MTQANFTRHGVVGLVLVMLWPLAPQPAEAAARGGGGARASGAGTRTASAGTRTAAAGSRSVGTSRSTVNRDLSASRNTNVNRNVNVDVDGHGYYRPVATAAAVTAGVALTSAAIGSMVYSLPPACTTSYFNGYAYQNCSGTWYQPQYAGSQVTYVVVPAPG